jgi:hypothetical protein
LFFDHEEGGDIFLRNVLDFQLWEPSMETSHMLGIPVTR